MKVRALLLLLLIVPAGCGVDWFPEYKRAATTPDPFTFTAQTGVAPSSTVTSDAITVAGITGTTSPISVAAATGTSDSKYILNGAAATATAGSVKNGDTVKVQHTASSFLGGMAKSTLTIGGFPADFTTTTSVTIPDKTGAAGTSLESDKIAIPLTSGLHSVKITDGEYSLAGAPFSTSDQPSINISDGATLILKNTVPRVTTFTIDQAVNPKTFSFKTTAQ